MTYLIDTSAAARMRQTEVARRLRPLIEGGVVATTTSLDAEGSLTRFPDSCCVGQIVS
ncbi:MAG: Ribonuclease VapC [Mycobacterium sp.]|jgi:hypothetical protein|nr:Ribonuclease VapC [Mycobacterium sp.]